MSRKIAIATLEAVEARIVSFAEGEPEWDLLDMAREGLRQDLDEWDEVRRKAISYLAEEEARIERLRAHLPVGE